MKAYQILLVILMLLMFASCTAFPSTNISSSSTPSNAQPQKGITQTPSDQSSGNPVSPINTPDFSGFTPLAADANPFVKLAEQDLADRLNITTDQIHFLKITEIDWQDITQGCSLSPGQTLTKGRVTGYRIWLETSGKNYLYHIGLDNTIFLCPQ